MGIAGLGILNRYGISWNGKSKICSERISSRCRNAPAIFMPSYLYSYEIEVELLSGKNEKNGCKTGYVLQVELNHCYAIVGKQVVVNELQKRKVRNDIVEVIEGAL